MAVLSANRADEAQRIFELKTVSDQPAWLLVTRNADAAGESSSITLGRESGGAPENLVLRAKVSRFGDPERERALLRAVAHRLQQLKGREWYPLD